MQSQYKNMALSNPAVAELYQIHHMEETRTGRCCSKIKRLHQLIDHNDSSCVGRASHAIERHSRPGTGRRPRVMVAARGEAFFRCEPVSRHGVMGRCEVPRSRARQL
uniref:Uncharacterized protein n=1 Tax=Setaria viridis TaxID=4556 RepID=A0A4U6ST75_SETVI|nr:hypothetical protein SEVIR_9G079400v2 [Setaria viridis]